MNDGPLTAANPLGLPAGLPGTQTVYLIRHGETDFNVQNVVQGGGVDSDLNPTGRAQASAFHAQYGQHPFVAVYASALKRTQQTLAPFAEAGVQVLIDPRLNEMGWGELEGATHNAHVAEVFREALQQWGAGNLAYRVAGGESPLEVCTRLTAALRDILLAHPEGDILVCTHGRALRILLAHVLGYGLRRMQDFHHANTGLNCLVRVGTTFYLSAMNDLSHLASPGQSIHTNYVPARPLRRVLPEQ